MELYKFVLGWIFVLVLMLIELMKRAKKRDIIVKSLGEVNKKLLMFAIGWCTLVTFIGVSEFMKNKIVLDTPAIITSIIFLILCYTILTKYSMKNLIAKDGIHTYNLNLKWNQIKSFKIVANKIENRCTFELEFECNPIQSFATKISNGTIKIEVLEEDKNRIEQVLKEKIA